PSVINPDIPPPPRPIISTPSGDRPLSPTNNAGAPNKRTRTVSEDAMNVDITSPSAPAPSLISTVPSGLPVNKVHVITSPQTITTPVETVDASIHAPSNTDGKGKAVAFDIPNDDHPPMVDCSLSRYSSYGTRARCDGSGDNKKILVFFYNHDDYTDCISSPRADFLDLAFSHYSPADAKLSDEMKSIFVTDIPLFLTETQVRQAFS
ncbi:hypothetical protein RhiirA1_483524, partial [Rhizophagus irregularis]